MFYNARGNAKKPVMDNDALWNLCVNEHIPSGDTNISALYFFNTAGILTSYQYFQSKGFSAGGPATTGIIFEEKDESADHRAYGN